MKVLKVRHMALVEDYPEDLPKRLTLTYTDTLGETVTIKAYKEEGNRLWIPRKYSHVSGFPVEKRKWKRVEIDFKGRLYSFQKELVKKFIKSGCNGILSVGTGKGKTVMALYLAHLLKHKTLVVVPTETIFKQWIQRVYEFCGFYPTTIRGSHCDVSTPIVIGMLKTLAIGKKIDREKLYTEFGFVIYDEVHRIATYYYNIVAGMFWDKYRLGLSATPRRRDGMHKLFEWHIGSIVGKYYVYPSELIPSVYMIRYIDWRCSTGDFIRGGELNLPLYHTHLAQIDNRNKLIVLYIYYGYKKGRRVMLLSDRLKQLLRIYKMLKELGIDDIGFLTGSVKDIDHQIILGTYGSGGEGFDLPELDYLIFGTPRADVRQSVGRLLRPKEKSPIIIDIVDNVSEIMRKFAEARMRYYRGLRCKIKEIFINGEKVYALYEKLLSKKKMGDFEKKKTQIPY